MCWSLSAFQAAEPEDESRFRGAELSGNESGRNWIRTAVEFSLARVLMGPFGVSEDQPYLNNWNPDCFCFEMDVEFLPREPPLGKRRLENACESAYAAGITWSRCGQPVNTRGDTRHTYAFL